MPHCIKKLMLQMRAGEPPGASKENARKPPGSRSLIRHLPFLQQNLHLNPNGVWLNPCSVRLCMAFKSPLLIKHTLQLQDPRYPCSHLVPLPAQFSPWGRRHFSHLLLLVLHQSSNTVTLGEGGQALP